MNMCEDKAMQDRIAYILAGKKDPHYETETIPETLFRLIQHVEKEGQSYGRMEVQLPIIKALNLHHFLGRP